MTSWEEEAVNEIEALELRRSVVLELITRKNETWMVAEALKLNTSKLEQEIDELFSEWEDIDKELGYGFALP